MQQQITTQTREAVSSMAREMLHLMADTTPKGSAVKALARAYSYIIGNGDASDFEEWLTTVIDEPYLIFASYIAEAVTEREVQP